LEYLTKKDGYGLQTYFKLENEIPVLYVGYPRSISSSTQSTHKFKFGYNIIQDNIQFISEDKKNIQVKCISIMPDNSRHEVILGNADGSMHTFNEYNVDKDNLKKIANQRLESLKKEGYEGDITVFGEPFVKKGDYVRITGDRFVNEILTYSISNIIRKFGLNGYRQTLTIDTKA